MLLAARDEATLAVTAEELGAAGGDVTHVAVDVSRPGGCAAMAAAAVDRFGGIGHAALFLATAEAGYITGQTLVVDGGQVLPESLDALP